MPVLTSFSPLIAALTLFTVYSPVTDWRALTMSSASTKPIWLKLPMPPATFLPYSDRMALYRFMVCVFVPSGGVSSALTKILPFHVDPSDLARKSVLHGVEQAHSLTWFSMLSFCAACRMTSASGGVKFSTTAPSLPAALTSEIATQFASETGGVAVMSTIGMFAALAIAFGPAAMYSVPGTLAWSKTILLGCCVIAYCTAPSELYRGPMLTAALFDVE